jgi:hypothetical protein
VPGRPARLLFTASVTAHSVASPVLFVQLVDAYGVSYQVEAGVFTANGRPHTFSVPVAQHGRTAAYPLRVTGFTLQYTMPKHHSGQAQLVIGPARATATLTSTAGPSFVPGRPGGRLSGFANAGDPTTLGFLKTTPAVTHATAGQTAVVITFKTGAGYGPPIKVCGFIPFRYPCGPHGLLPSTLTIAAGGRPGPVPVAITSAFASAIGSHHLGYRFSTDFLGTTIQLKVVSVIRAFPTISGPYGGAVVDQAALQNDLAAAGSLPALVTEWWLRTSRPVSLTGLPPGTTIVSRADVAASLLANPLAAAPQLAMLAIAAAAVILAAAGFLVSAATARERAHEMALLAALGATKRQLTRLLCLEQAAVAVPAAVAGLLLGGLLARLVIPAVSLTPTGTPPQPPVIVQTPLLIPGAVALLMAVGPVLLAATGVGTRSRVVSHTRVEATT